MAPPGKRKHGKRSNDANDDDVVAAEGAPSEAAAALAISEADSSAAPGRGARKSSRRQQAQQAALERGRGISNTVDGAPPKAGGEQQRPAVEVAAQQAQSGEEPDAAGRLAANQAADLGDLGELQVPQHSDAGGNDASPSVSNESDEDEDVDEIEEALKEKRLANPQAFAAEIKG